MTFTFKGYFDSAEFEVDSVDTVDLRQYEYIQFSSKEAQKAVFNFYKNEMQQGGKIDSANLGFEHIRKIGFFDLCPRNPSWTKFRDDICPIILYSFEVGERSIRITPLNVQDSNKLYRYGEPRILKL
ncbi:MAG: hypothetical protein II858_05765 [Bacteroidales bacterium]|nr:hypothetical protein [Bacteroidales bacterium]